MTEDERASLVDAGSLISQGLPEVTTRNLRRQIADAHVLCIQSASETDRDDKSKRLEEPAVNLANSAKIRNELKDIVAFCERRCDLSRNELRKGGVIERLPPLGLQQRL